MASHPICKARLSYQSGHSFDEDRQDKYIPPKKPYSLEAMLDDILEFAASTLIDHARLSLWMPTANDQEIELGAPTHDCLDIISVCVQPFNKCKILWGSYVLQSTRIEYSRITVSRVKTITYLSTNTRSRDQRSIRAKT